MKDRKGNEVKVGDRVYVLPSAPNERDGGLGFIRDFKQDERGENARIDDGPADCLDICTDTRWTWSARCKSNEFELVSAGSTVKA